MYVEIRKSGFVNKGDELILRTINFLIKKDLPGARVVIDTDFRNGFYEQRMELGLYQKIWRYRYRVQWGRLARCVPESVRRANGMILDSQLKVVLDASGFHYGDQFGPGPCREAAEAIRRWKKSNAKVILMPQALGPFKNPQTRKYFKLVADLADLILVRDKISYENATELAEDPRRIRLSPDITILMDGEKPEYFNPDEIKFPVVPNIQMIEKTSRQDGARYVPFMARCVRQLMAQGAKPFILIHGGDRDLLLGQEINSHFDGKLRIIRELNPVKIKGIIGACDGLLGSRFHSIVNALSQGVPAFVTGWSHKYNMLMDDFGFPHGLLSLGEADDAVQTKLEIHRRREDWESLKSLLKINAGLHRQKAKERWQEIVALIAS